MKNLALMWVLAALFVLNISSCNSKSANRLSDSGSAVVNDSVMWFENMSSIELKFEIDGLSIDIFGTSEGAIARYSNLHRMEERGQRVLYSLLERVDDRKEEKFLEIRLDMEIWQNILKCLFNSGIRGWEKNGSNVCPCYIVILDYVSSYKLKIFNRNSGDILVGSCGCYYEYPEHQPISWSTFYSEMINIIKNIIKIPLDTEHKKKFGTLASDFEQSILLVMFEKTIVLKRMNGTIMAMNELIPDSTGSEYWFTLDVSDWFDIIHVLGNGACELNKNVDTEEQPDSRKVLINKSTKNFTGKRVYITASDEFKKVMDGITYRIKNEKRSK